MATKIKEENLRMNLIINGDKAKKEMIELQDKIREGTAAVKKLTAERDLAIKTYGKESFQAKKLEDQLTRTSGALGLNKKELAAMKEKMDLTTYSMQDLRKHMRQLRTILAETKPNTPEWTKYNKELDEAKQRLAELQGKGQKTGSALKSMAGKFIGIGTAVALLTKGLKGAMSNIADFEQANVNLSTILGVNVKQMGLLMDDALELGRRTQYTASQVTGLQTELAKLGFTQTQIHNMTASTLNFATAVGTDLSSAAALAGATLRIFDLDSKDTDDALGVLAVSTNRSALSFSYLQTAMSIVGPVAKSFGFSLRDTTTLLGTLANAGFDASSAATATRNILLNLADSSGKLATALGKPVKTFPELMDGLKTLNERGINLNETLAITDKRSVAAFSRFLSGAEDALALRDALEDVDGELGRIADERMNTVEGAVKSLQSAWEGFTLAFSNSKGPIKNFLQWMANEINKITDKLEAPARDTKANAAEYVDYLFTQEGSEAGVKKRIDDYIAKEEKHLQDLNAELASVVEEEKRTQEKGFRGDEGGLNFGYFIQLALAGHAIKGPSAIEKEKRNLEKRIRDAQDGLNYSYNMQEAFLERQGAGGASGTSGSGQSGTQAGNASGAGIDTGKNKTKWSLNNDESFLAAKAALTKRYNDGELSSKEEYDEQLYQLEIASLNARLVLNKEKGADRAAIEADIQKRIMSHNESARKEAEKLESSLQTDKTAAAKDAEEKRYQEDLKAFEKSKSALTDQAKIKEDIEAKHRRYMAKIDADADNERLQLQAANNKLEIDSIRNAHMERISTMKQGSLEQKQALKAMRLEIANAELSHMEQYLRDLEALLGKQEGNGSTDEEITKTKQAIAQAKAEIIQVKAVLNGESGKSAFSGTGTGDLFGVSERQWETLFGHLKEGKFAADDLKATIAGIGGAAEEGLKIASQAIAMVNAQEQKELKDYQKINDKKKKDLQKRLSAGLISQSQYDRSLEELQEEQDAKEEEMQERQAERQKKLSITQAIIQSALAVAKTFAEWGYPYGIAPAAIMAALGAAQVALIAATPTGFAEGGEVTRAQDGRKFNARLSPNKRGFIGSPTILVGEEGGEYVIPADGLRNPSLAPFIGSIEAARRAGTLRSINFGAVSPAMSAFAPAMATGGASSPMAVVTPDYSAIIAEMQALGQKLETVRAVVPLLGKGGIVEAMDSYETIKKRGRL